MTEQEASDHIVDLEGRVVILLAQLESLRRVGRRAPGTLPVEARLAQIGQIRAGLERVLVDLEHAYGACRRVVADTSGPASAEGATVH